MILVYRMLPCTPITEEVRLKKFVEEEWNSIIGRVAPGAVEGWRSILYMNYATLNPAEAFRQLLTVPLDNGVSRTWALVKIDLSIRKLSIESSFLVLDCHSTEC